MLGAKRILTVNHIHSLLMHGVENLLEANRNDQFEVVSTSANNLLDLIHDIEQWKPNIIIIEEDFSFITLADLIIPPLNLRNVRLIVVNIRSSNIDIYEKREFLISNPQHLLEAVTEGAPSLSEGGERQ